jgi:TAT (twin-arginine translocation) pathway signal sequence
MSKINLYNAELSRRSLLKSTTVAAAGVALVSMTDSAFAKRKRTQADVAYQDYPHGSERCDNCEPFIPPNHCKTVLGEVDAKGWCKIWAKK